MNTATRRQRALLSAIVTLFWFAQYVYIPFQTPFLTACAVSSSMIGVIVGAYGVSQLLARLPVGVAADTVHRHRSFILLGCLFAGGASLLRVGVPTGTGFLMANLGSGFASAMWISFVVLYTGYYPAEQLQKGTGHVVLFNNAGILSGFLAASLLHDVGGMKLLCLLSFGAGAIAALLALGLAKPQPTNNPPLPVRTLLSVCGSRRLWQFALLAALQQGIQMSTTMSFTTQVLQDRGASAAVIGGSSVFYMLCAVGASAFASGEAFRRKGAAFWIPTVFLLLAGYCVLVPLVPQVWALCALQAIPGLSTGILFSTLTSEAMVGVPAAQKSTAMGLYQAVYAVGMTIFPILAGRLSDGISRSAAFFALAALALLGGCAALLLNRKEPRHV